MLPLQKEFDASWAARCFHLISYFTCLEPDLFDGHDVSHLEALRTAKCGVGGS